MLWFLGDFRGGWDQVNALIGFQGDSVLWVEVVNSDFIIGEIVLLYLLKWSWY
jgi:hypothetical protein